MEHNIRILLGPNACEWWRADRPCQCSRCAPPLVLFPAPEMRQAPGRRTQIALAALTALGEVGHHFSWRIDAVMWPGETQWEAA